MKSIGSILLLLLPSTTMASLNSAFCDPIASDQCSTCRPVLNTEYCSLDTSLPILIQYRNERVRADPQGVIDSGYWFPILNNKVVAQTFSASLGYRIPRVLYCGSLENLRLPSSGGFVVKATELHSSRGICVFPLGLDGPEVLTGEENVTLAMIQSTFRGLNVSELLVEEFVGTVETMTLPTEYKFHVFGDGTIGAVNIVQDRGTDCSCWAEVDTNFERLDTFGCFAPAGRERFSGGCPDIELGTRFTTVKKDFPLCNDVTRPSDCVWNDMMRIAADVGRRIGVYVRVDMFVNEQNEIFLQEYSFNHMNGKKHCSAVFDDEGCLDPCHLGLLWPDGLFGGNTTAHPFPNFSGNYCDRIELRAGFVRPGRAFQSSCQS